MSRLKLVAEMSNVSHLREDFRKFMTGFGKEGFMEAHTRKHLLIACLLACLFFLKTGFANAQDIYVNSVTVTPSSGQAGDTVSLQATIGNNGPGMALVIQLRRYLSEDNVITTEDMALGDVETLYDYLYEGQEITINRQVALPPFEDAETPSYLGLILDPYEFLSDGYSAQIN